MAHQLIRMAKKPVVCLIALLLILAGVGAFVVVHPKPQYCWLAFGPNAHLRILVCMKEKTVSLEHYADGKPTGRKEQFRIDADPEPITVADPDGATSYIITRVGEPLVPEGAHPELFVNVE